MHKLAKRILELTKPTLEKMLDEKISEKELDCAEKMVRIAHDLIESDVMLGKLEGEKSSDGYENDTKDMYENPKKKMLIDNDRV